MPRHYVTQQHCAPQTRHYAYRRRRARVTGSRTTSKKPVVRSLLLIDSRSSRPRARASHEEDANVNRLSWQPDRAAHDRTRSILRPSFVGYPFLPYLSGRRVATHCFSNDIRPQSFPPSCSSTTAAGLYHATQSRVAALSLQSHQATCPIDLRLRKRLSSASAQASHHRTHPRIGSRRLNNQKRTADSDRYIVYRCRDKSATALP
jgi:hypothetical protein